MFLNSKPRERPPPFSGLRDGWKGLRRARSCSTDNFSDLDFIPKNLKRNVIHDVGFSPEPVAVENLRQNDIIISVMGPTGAGKSTFIQTATDSSWGVGHGLRSATSEVSAARIRYSDNINIVLVDAPGFDDAHKSDLEILETISAWFKNLHRLSGIVYLHRITDNRMAGTPKKNLELFGKLCGEDFYESTILTTMMWPESLDENETILQEREAGLKREYWADMIARGAETERFRGTRASAWGILERLIAKANERQQRKILEIQKELVDLSKSIPATKAGQQLHAMIERQVQKQVDLLGLLRDELSRDSNPILIQEYLRQLEWRVTDTSKPRKIQRRAQTLLQNATLNALVEEERNLTDAMYSYNKQPRRTPQDQRELSKILDKLDDLGQLRKKIQADLQPAGKSSLSPFTWARQQFTRLKEMWIRATRTNVASTRSHGRAGLVAEQPDDKTTNRDEAFR